MQLFYGLSVYLHKILDKYLYVDYNIDMKTGKEVGGMEKTLYDWLAVKEFVRGFGAEIVDPQPHIERVWQGDNWRLGIKDYDIVKGGEVIGHIHDVYDKRDDEGWYEIIIY